MWPGSLRGSQRLPGDSRVTQGPDSATRELRSALARTWFPFFGRFGRLTEVQTRAMPHILAGRNLVVISPAASGKTEAVAAPVVERLMPERRARFSVLYVSPTRALVNDLFRRLSEPMEYLGLKLARKTGDHPAIDESRLPFMLITTPESFDSLLCRHTRIFRELAAVILDELHLLDNTPRGDQLRVLLERLRLVNSGVQYCALSATIDDTDIGKRYFPDPVVVNVESRRRIEHELLGMDDDWPEKVVERLRERKSRKVLCFFNARSSVESSAKMLELPPFRGRVWVHHASLNRKVREQVEETMNRERVGLLCCTSTLELGIDIGDVDAVVLVRPPFNVSSLLQRIGRGNRRRASWLFALGLYQNEWERFMFETLFECAREGRLYGKKYTSAPAVIPQQIFSYMFQRRRIGTTAESVRRVMTPVFGSSGSVEQVFRHLAEQGEVVVRRSNVFFLSPKTEKQVEYGKIHSNIQEKSFGKYEVYEAATNRHLGTVFFRFRHFMLGGRAWETIEFREKEMRILVRPLEGVGATTKVFEGTGTGGYGYPLARKLKSRLFPELKPDQFPCYQEGSRVYFVHLLGSTLGFMLTEAFAVEGADVSDLDGKLLSVPVGLVGDRPTAFPVPEMPAFRQVARQHLSRLEDSLGSGAFFRSLPPELQVEDHLLALDIPGLVRFLGGIEPVLMAAGEVARHISRHLAADTAARQK